MASNWAKLKSKLESSNAKVSVKITGKKTITKSGGVVVKQKRTDLLVAAGKLPASVENHEFDAAEEESPFPRSMKDISSKASSGPITKLSDLKPPACAVDWRDKQKYIALDCEMVGIGVDGKTSALARCSVVDFEGRTIYDEHVRPPAFVTDFRTEWSGVRKHDLRQGHAISLQQVFA